MTARDVVALGLLTLAGMALRFYRLDHPCLWNDEALTFARTCGSFAQLMERIRHDGFEPLHYVLVWLLKGLMPLTPFALRLIPALCGTAMIPAMWVLADRLVSRRVAWTTTAFTAFSAFLLVYSRDAKMYMPLWLFAVLTMNGFLHWAERRSRRAALAWLLPGLILVNLHMLGFLVILAQAIWLSSRIGKGDGRLAAGFGAGVLTLAALPAAYYALMNQWHAHIRDQGWSMSGLDWVGLRNAEQTGVRVVLDTVSAYLMAWSWIDQPGGRGQLQPLVAFAGYAASGLVLGLVALGLATPLIRRRQAQGAEGYGEMAGLGVIWLLAPATLFFLSSGMRLFTTPQAPRLPDWGLAGAAATGLATAGLVFLVHRMPTAKRQFRRLAAALALPTGVGLMLYVGLTDPIRPLPGGGSAVLMLAPAGMLAAIVVAGTWRRPRLNGAVVRTTGVMGLLAVGTAAYAHWQTTHGLWLPRYLGVAWPALAVAVCTAMDRLPRRAWRAGALTLLLGTNIVQGLARICLQTEPPMDRIAADVLAAQADDAPVRTYVQAPTAHWGPPGTGALKHNVGKYYLYQQSGQPVTPGDFFFQPATRAFRIRAYTTPEQLGSETAGEKHIRQVICWQRPDLSPSPAATLAALGPGWRLAEEQLYTVRVFWNWALYYEYRRCRFARYRSRSVRPWEKSSGQRGQAQARQDEAGSVGNAQLRQGLPIGHEQRFTQARSSRPTRSPRA